MGHQTKPLMLPARYVLHHALIIDPNVVFVAQFMLPTVVIYSAICDILETDGLITEAIGFLNMQRELTPDFDSKEGQWESSELYWMGTTRVV